MCAWGHPSIKYIDVDTVIRKMMATVLILIPKLHELVLLNAFNDLNILTFRQPHESGRGRQHHSFLIDGEREPQDFMWFAQGQHAPPGSLNAQGRTTPLCWAVARLLQGT